MKKLLILLYFFSIICFSQKDTTRSEISKLPTGRKTNQLINYKQIIIPASLIVTGSLLRNSQTNLDVKKYRDQEFSNFKTESDDYFQYVPFVLTYSGNYLGFKSKHGNKQMFTNHIVSSLIMSATVIGIKKMVGDLRPDYTAFNSFPSGHTTNAFNLAMMQYLEYKDDNLWFASSGFVFAITTGLFRVLNDRHWLSDVVAGSGIGMLTSLIVFHWSPFNFDNKKEKQTSLIYFPVVGEKFAGVGLQLNFR